MTLLPDSISSEKTDLKASQQDPLPIYTTAQGLRSIPYIVLSDTSMTETGALHLSYILACHTSPEFLLTRVPPAKAGPPAQQLTSYDGTDCRGIVYLPNSLLSNAGQKVLELAETIRDSHLDCVDNSMVEATSELSITPPKSSTASRRASGVRSVPTLGGRSRRRRSTASTGANNQDTLLGNELDRARSRIQCNALQDAGPQSNDLWRSALRMLSLARQIRPQTRKDLPPMKIKGPSVWTLDTTSINPRTLKSLTPLTLQRDSNQPISPRTIQFRKKSSSTPPTPAIIAPTHLSPNTCTHTPALAKETADYRTELPCGLPADVWRRILGFAAGANGIMSEVQQQSVLRWAMDRKTLSRESESLGLRESAQCWKILEATGCLAYEMG